MFTAVIFFFLFTSNALYNVQACQGLCAKSVSHVCTQTEV